MIISSDWKKTVKARVRYIIKVTMKQLDLRQYEDRQRFYKSKVWRFTRNLVLNEEPMCRHCRREGKIVSASEVDHILSIQSAPRLALEWDNLCPLCKSCHSKKTAIEMGFGKQEAPQITKKWKL